MNAKYISIIVLIVFAIGTYWFFNPKTPTLDSLRVEASEAQLREKEATKARLETEDKLSQALYDQCYSQTTSQTGSRFEEKQRKAYECWKNELSKTNSGTVASAISEAPPKGITPTIASTATSGSIKKAQSHTSSVQSVKKKDLPQSSENSNYWTAYNTAVKLIRKWEGLRLKAYWDFSHCSIGYGFSSPCGKTITQKQADQMLSEKVHADLAIIRSDFPDLSSEAQGALASFKHNCPKGYLSVQKNGLKWFNSWCKSAGGERMQGLVNRRSAEWKIISYKN